jgi:hypothetical protein
MKRLGAFFSAVLLASVISGCTDAGIKEGMSTETPTPTGQPPGFKEIMERDGGKMSNKGGVPADAKKRAAEAAKQQ